ncbi:hypothetical protein FACS189459_0340 [Bacilli bacterium]|nr:hypothetical protein FACS189459_0340 [Bacilli bacterium]
MKKVFITGIYDIIHYGHISFMKECAKYGDLYVGICNDKYAKKIKRQPITPQEQRLYIVKNIKPVKDAFIIENINDSYIDGFIDAIKSIKPDIFIMNNDSNAVELIKQICKKLNIEFILKDRKNNEISTSKIIKNIKKK